MWPWTFFYPTLRRVCFVFTNFICIKIFGYPTIFSSSPIQAIVALFVAIEVFSKLCFPFMPPNHWSMKFTVTFHRVWIMLVTLIYPLNRQMVVGGDFHSKSFSCLLDIVYKLFLFLNLPSSFDSGSSFISSSTFRDSSGSCLVPPFFAGPSCPSVFWTFWM